jgi:predicted nucleic-acid-binding protein
MIGVDTNVLVRLIVNDDDRQARAVERFILENSTANARCYVSNMALIETVWVLETVYCYERSQVAEAMEAVLEVAQFDFDSPTDAKAAVDDFRRGPAEFVDCLIGRMNRFVGCEYTVTFDRKAAKLEGFRLLKA